MAYALAYVNFFLYLCSRFVYAHARLLTMCARNIKVKGEN